MLFLVQHDALDQGCQVVGLQLSDCGFTDQEKRAICAKVGLIDFSSGEVDHILLTSLVSTDEVEKESTDGSDVAIGLFINQLSCASASNDIFPSNLLISTNLAISASVILQSRRRNSSPRGNHIFFIVSRGSTNTRGVAIEPTLASP